MCVTNELIGNLPIDEVGSSTTGIPWCDAIRRRNLYSKFYRRDKGMSVPYRSHDVPAIAFRYHRMWNDVELMRSPPAGISKRMFKPEDLGMIEEDFRLILMCSNMIGKIQIVSNSVVASLRDSVSIPISNVLEGTRADASKQASITSPRPNKQSKGQPTTVTPDRMSPTLRSISRLVSLGDNISSCAPNTRIGNGVLPIQLLCSTLLCTNEYGAIMWSKFPDLASLEAMLHLFFQKDIAANAIEGAMEERKIPSPLSVNSTLLVSMSNRNINNAVQNIKDARNDLMDHLGGYYHPAEDNLLYEWHRDSIRNTEGRRPEANIFELSTQNRRNQFATWAKYTLRHIYFSFNVSLEQLGSLWACLYALIMQRPITNDKFLSDTSIWTNIMSLWQAEKKIQTKRLHVKLQKKTKHGFSVFTYFSSEHSKHHGRNKHVLISTDFEEDNASREYICVPFQPSFRLISASPNCVWWD